MNKAIDLTNKGEMNEIQHDISIKTRGKEVLDKTKNKITDKRSTIEYTVIQIIYLEEDS